MDELTEYKHALDYWEAKAHSLRAELAEVKRANWKVAHIKDLEAQLTERRDRVDNLDKELAEWKERHPYGEVDLDMAIEAETKDLKLRIDTLESAQIDYEAQCAAKDAHNKEEFDKYCRNLTELAQVHKESCDAKDARIAELEKSQPTFDECMAYVARAERAEARIAGLEATILHWTSEVARLEHNCDDDQDRAERAEAAAACYARQVGSADAENANLRDAVKRAEARIAECNEALERGNARFIAAEARVAELEELRVTETRKWAIAEVRAECAEAKLAAVDQQRENFFWDKRRAEAERDALLYNADSKYCYCAGMSAGFELGRNDDRAELSRIITQRWMEIADAKARAALATPKE